METAARTPRDVSGPLASNAASERADRLRRIRAIVGASSGIAACLAMPDTRKHGYLDGDGKV